MTKDNLSRDDVKPRSTFELPAQLPAQIQAVLKRAASRGYANGPENMREIVGRDWLMVPSKKGVRQIVVTSGRAFRI